jgi:hypothetical protein
MTDATAYGGSDALDEQQHTELDEVLKRSTKTLEAAVGAAQETKIWLNTALGRSVREAIATNKYSAMERAASQDSDAAATAQAKADYAKWSGVEEVFAVIITGGAEALNQLNLEGMTDA